MTSSTTEKTLEVLESLLSRYGLPWQLVSDNGPQFTAFEFEECMRANGIKHLLSAPYHPATNGEAERFVQTFKKSLRAGKDDSGTVPQKLARFLLTFQTTPHAMAPAELFLKRQVRTQLDLLKPSVEGHVRDRQMEQKRYHDRHVQERSFQVGQPVLARKLREGEKFVRGSVIRKLGPANYEIMVQGQVWKRHGNQLLAYKGNTNESESGLSEPPESRVPESVSEPPSPLGEPLVPIIPQGPDCVVVNPGTAGELQGSPPEGITPTTIDNSVSQHTPQSPLPLAPSTRLPVVPTPKVYPCRNRQPPDRFKPTLILDIYIHVVE